jgi:hypothetical protein
VRAPPEAAERAEKTGTEDRGIFSRGPERLEREKPEQLKALKTAFGGN